jgi:hypothetical protein
LAPAAACRIPIGRYTVFPVKQIMWVYLVDGKNRIHFLFATQVRPSLVTTRTIY